MGQAIPGETILLANYRGLRSGRRVPRKHSGSDDRGHARRRLAGGKPSLAGPSSIRKHRAFLGLIVADGTIPAVHGVPSGPSRRMAI